MQMAQEAKRRIAPDESIWEQLTGKTVVLAGNENSQKACFRQNLAHLAGRLGGRFSLSDDLSAAGSEDLVFLFGMPQAGACRMEALLEALAEISVRRLSCTALVTATKVYGKQFGASHAFTEQELGYACHTSAADMALSEMRLAENLAHRLAAEEGLPIKIVRMEESPGGDCAEAMLEAAVKVLLYGVPGEAYNLPGSHENAETDAASRLSPLPVRTDTRKVQSLDVRGK